MDNAPSKRGGWFLRAVVVLIVWIALAAGAYYVLVILPGGATPAAPETTGTTQRPELSPPARTWDPDAIADRPAEFIADAMRRADELASARERRLQALAARRGEVEQKAAALRKDLTDAENVGQRMRQAVDRAEAEDRWPVRMAGRSFDRAKATQIIEETRRHVEARRPLVEAYDAVLAEYASRADALRREAEELRTLRERLAIDLETARLDASRVDVGRLQQVHRQLEAAADAGTASDDDAQLRDLQQREGENLDLNRLLQ